ncbi:MAG: ceramidase domain-containing protein [Pseudomonadota bacterium]
MTEAAPLNATVYEKIFAYCERGMDPSFWAEPLNAVSNIAFVLTGLAGLWFIGRIAAERRSLYAWTLALLALLIAIGSFLWHTVAERWAGAMDVIPIMIFMLLAVYALGRKVMGWPILAAFAGVGAFLVAGWAIAQIPCEGAACSSKGYGAAWLTLALSGGVLHRAVRPDQAAAGRMLLYAAAVFTVSLTLRSLDKPTCDWFVWNGSPLGTHYWWHMLNAVTLYLVIRAFWLQEALSDHRRPSAAATLSAPPSAPSAA